MKGFTLFETLIAMTTISLVSLVTVQILFSSLNLRDVALTTTKTEESLRVFDRVLRVAVTETTTVTGGGTSLFLTSNNLCWSFVYDSVNQALNYSKSSEVGCTPNMNPSTSFFPPSTKATSFSFVVTPISSGGHEVRVNSVFQTKLPLSDYQTTFSNTFLNFVD